MEGEMRSGQILRISEILKLDQIYDGKCVRTWGKVLYHDISTSTSKISNDGSEMLVDTSLVEPYAFSTNSMYLFIGDLQFEGQQVLLRATVTESMEGTNVQLFNKALDARREYLKEKIPR